jgi:hypothetical protein
LNNAAVHVWQQGAKQRRFSIALNSTTFKKSSYDNGNKPSYRVARNGRIASQMKKNGG